MRRHIFIRILTISAFLYAILGIIYYHAQDRILFRPVAVPADHRYDFNIPFREMIVNYRKGSDLHLTQFPVPANVSRRGIVIYFHGNRRNVSWYVDRVPYFTRMGYEVWMPDYPGFGKSTGILDEETLHQFARQTYLLARKGCSADSIWIYGRSMGTGIAARLASEVSSRGLVLETPYRSIPSLVAVYLPIYPVGRMSHFQLPVGDFLLRVRVPVTIIHGSEDCVIPWRHAAGLRDALKEGDRFVTVEGAGHNDLPVHGAYRQVMDSLFAIPRE